MTSFVPASAQWLDMPGEEAALLSLRAMSEPWEAWERPPQHVPRAAVVEQQLARANSPWVHHVLQCPRTLTDADTDPPSTRACFINVHLLRLHDPSSNTALNAVVGALALKQEAKDLGCSRSNVGGFHSTDDLWSWPGMKKCALPALIDAAVLQVEQYERHLCDLERRLLVDNAHPGVAHQIDGGSRRPAGDAASACCKPEAWLNVSRSGNWNHLHTHPGATFSGCYYVAAGGCSSAREGEGSDENVEGCGVQALAGRLLLLPWAPQSVSEHALALVHPSPSPAATLETPNDDAQEADIKSFLKIEAEPGTLVIWPSFVSYTRTHTHAHALAHTHAHAHTQPHTHLHRCCTVCCRWGSRQARAQLIAARLMWKEGGEWKQNEGEEDAEEGEVEEDGGGRKEERGEETAVVKMVLCVRVETEKQYEFR